MGDDVVELARDAGSLVCDCRLDLDLLLGLQLGRASLQAVAAQHAAAERLTKRPGDRIEDPFSGGLVEAAWQRRAVTDQLKRDDHRRTGIGLATGRVGGCRIHDEDLR